MNRAERRRAQRRSTRVVSPTHSNGQYKGNQAEYLSGYLWMMQWLAEQVGTEIVGDSLNEYMGKHHHAITRDCKRELRVNNRSRDFIAGVLGYMATIGRTFAPRGFT